MGATSEHGPADPKRKLMRAATELIWLQNYASVSVEAICEKAGIKKGSFYYFFASKAELAVAALEAQWSSIQNDLDRIFLDANPPLHRLELYFDFILESQTKLHQRYGRVLGCPYGCLGTEISALDDIVLQKVRDIMGRTPRYFEKALKDAAGQGLVSNQEISARAEALFNYMEGVLMRARIQNDLEPIRLLRASAMRFVTASSLA